MVEVEWEDSVAKGGWHDLNQLARASPVIIVSVGFELPSSTNYVLLAKSKCTGDEIGDVGDVLKIPRVLVRRVRQLIPIEIEGTV